MKIRIGAVVLLRRKASVMHGGLVRIGGTLGPVTPQLIPLSFRSDNDIFLSKCSNNGDGSTYPAQGKGDNISLLLVPSYILNAVPARNR
jgi:hypothetical protein